MEPDRIGQEVWLMKQIWKAYMQETGLALLLGLVVPASLLGLAVKLKPQNEKEDVPTVVVSGIATEENVEQTGTIPISVLMGGNTVQMDLEDYLVGVVLGEMPADFEPEALKAQAIVARTFTLKTRTSGKHDNGDVCTDAGCCQAFQDPDLYLKQGGDADGLERIRAAVSATAGLVLTYQGELIEATYFSCSGGRTEDAVAVWGTDVPYLRATDSPGEEQAAHYTDTVTFSGAEFAQALGMELSGDAASWLGYVTYTDGGGINTMTIGGKSFQGTELRKRLGLRSTVFTMVAEGDQITVTTKGYGHRVGMSQYGADAMAVGGSSAEEILAHYYRGSVLTTWTDD